MDKAARFDWNRLAEPSNERRDRDAVLGGRRRKRRRIGAQPLGRVRNRLGGARRNHAEPTLNPRQRRLDPQHPAKLLAIVE